MILVTIPVSSLLNCINPCDLWPNVVSISSSFNIIRFVTQPLCNPRKECSCQWRRGQRERWNIRFQSWLSIGFLCFSPTYFSDSLNRISLILLATCYWMLIKDLKAGTNSEKKYGRVENCRCLYAPRAQLGVCNKFELKVAPSGLNWAEKGRTGFI